MSGEFDSRKASHSTKLEHRPQIFVKLSFRESCGSNLSGLHHFDNMVAPPEITVGTHFHVRHGTKTIPGFLLADG